MIELILPSVLAIMLVGILLFSLCAIDIKRGRRKYYFKEG